MRDMIQNHLLELMTFVAMECPANLGADSIRDEMAKVLSCLRPMDDAAVEKNTVRGQYAGGMCGGVQTAAYVDEPNVAKDSAVETYVAMKAFIDNRRWSGVPFYFYTGKRLAQKRSEISVNFKPAPPLFSGLCGENMRNKLSIIIQPDEGISLQFALKIPGKSFSATQVSMDFNYSSLADVTLPDGTGFSVCEQVREKGSTVPIIFLTASDEEVNVIRGLDSGGDDYITKPFKLGELLSRIRALLRRAGISAAQPANQMQCGDLTIDLLSGRAAMCGHPLELTQAEFRLLCLLVRNAGRVVTREVILNDLWDNAGDFVDDNTLSVYVRRLREKVEKDPSQPKYLLTVRGYGYQWKGEGT